MPLIETIVTLAGSGALASAGLGSGLKDLVEFLKSRVGVDDVLTDLVSERFAQHLPRLKNLCLTGEPSFDKAEFKAALEREDLQVTDPEGLIDALLPFLVASVDLPGALRTEKELEDLYRSILNASIRGMWKRISSYPAITAQVLLSRTDDLARALSETSSTSTSIRGDVAQLQTQLDSLAEFAKAAWSQVYDKLLDTAPPSEHSIGTEAHLNPFLFARAEDFNHNYDHLARLFQDSPEWASIQSASDNVFIEGGRGTGKSMLLRRLTAQATFAAMRMESEGAPGFDRVSANYFGVYVKLTRGYYEQLGPSETVSAPVADLLAQHELNVEIFDAFVDAIRWLIREHALPEIESRPGPLVAALSGLFTQSPKAHSLAELQELVVHYEQAQIRDYFRERAFGREGDYQGSATDSVAFLRSLAHAFREQLFPSKPIRLFLLMDEFETLLEVQQRAVNTIIKMRLPELTCKIAVRRAGRKTSDTFTPGDPIQDPRDYTEVPLDYDVTSNDYADLLAGIAEKRLRHAGYSETDIRKYLADPQKEETSESELDAAISALWETGNRRTEAVNAEFREKYRVAATHRVLKAKHRRKGYSGFDQYVLLSSGIVSNFIELSKYAFYFALSDQLPLHAAPRIPAYLQTEAAYGVSHRLLGTLGGNVPVVGVALEGLLTDLGTILRNRLLNHPSEPEANRLSVLDYGRLSDPANRWLAAVLDGAVVWSVLHLETPATAFRAKNQMRPPSAELIINRIYCPALGISPRARWRAEMTTTELRGLLEPNTRSSTFGGLMKSVGWSRAPDSTQPPLFS